MNILVTLDSNYLKPLRIMLQSLFMNNTCEKFHIYVIHANLEEDDLEDLKRFIELYGSKLHVIHVDDNFFGDAPLVFHYTKEMYFRLLACKLLPETMDRILYLDPDILVINPIKNLYEMELQGFLYGAAYHNKISVKEINKVRLLPYEIDEYYNSGVLLMNLKELRNKVDENEIYQFVEENRSRLIMPDQDILNALYAKEIKNIDEILYNYDARYYSYYKLISKGVCDMEYIINHTVILHFCGKRKPWTKKYNGRFESLYRHYEKCTNEVSI